MKRKLLVITFVLIALLLIHIPSVFRQDRTLVEGNPFEQWHGKTVLIFSPHPHDDVMGCGGAVALLSGHGNRLIVVFLTSGEKGTFDPSMNPTTLTRIRRQEAAAAYHALGFPDAQLLWLGYHDGELDFIAPRELRIQLTHLIRKFRPDVVFGLDPGLTYYRYHYRDHRTAALAVADAIGAAMWPLEFPERGVGAFRVPDVFYFYTAEPNLKLDISPVYELKLKALAEHRSQFPPANQHYSAKGRPPSRADLEALIVPLTGATTTELFRHR